MPAAAAAVLALLAFLSRILKYLKPTYVEFAELPTGLNAPFHHGRGSTLGPHHPLFTYDPQVSHTLTCVGKDPIHLNEIHLR